MRLSLACALALVISSGCPAPTPPEDAGPTPDADRACASDAECDDGRACNGVETCAAGACVDGVPIACDDGVACTVDRCAEEIDGCTFEANDADGDGFGDIACLDDAGVPLGDDCDDADDARFPGNVERCDPAGHDEDCDFSTRGGLDEDGDGFESASCCNPTEAGGTTCGDDCNDAVALVNPRGIEVCNLRDDDCDGLSDAEEGLTLALFVDADRDGYGDSLLEPVDACVSQSGFSVNGGDCDDRPRVGVARSPGQPEFCDVIDNDCDTRVDEDTVFVPFYADADDDGFGDASDVLRSCVPIPGRSLLATDCDDARASRNPSVAEICNGVDDDCNGLPDASTPAGSLEDDDLDGLADLGCGAPLGVDCDDTSAAVGAGSLEICDGRDNDCDDSFDEGVDMTVFYADRDRDGYGSIASGAFVGCGAPTGFVALAGDCADTDAARYPGGSEACNGRDDDCDGTADESPASDACVIEGKVVANGASCVAGRCTVECPEGYADCDGVFEDGCEVSLRFDEDNCGGCGVVCSSANAYGRSCGESGCTAFCLPGFHDCVGGSDGCETPDSVSDCGSCGVRCPAFPNSVPSCDAGSCSTTCSAGFFDCDGVVTNGCESRTACAVCGAGTADCNLDGACDDLTEDPSNCGACGRVCGVGSSCLGGTCDEVVSIAIGARHTCALRRGGTVLCWGANDEGQVDPSPGFDRATRPIPAVVPGIADAIAITAGSRHTCAIRASGRVTCWGSNMIGQLGRLGMPSLHQVDDVLSAFTTPARLLDAGGDHTCASTARQLVCWGDNGRNESAIVGMSPIAPTTRGELPGSAAVRLLSVAAGYSCYGTATEAVNCFGLVPVVGASPFGGAWDAGLNALDPALSPLDVTSLEAGGTHVCITTAGGEVYCRGENQFRQLGTSSDTPFGSPAIYEGGQLFGATDLWLGFDTTCARVALGRLVCLGGTGHGELGLGGTSGGRVVATPPNRIGRVRLLAHGSDDGHVCAVDLADRSWCWGHNNDAGAGGTVHRLGLNDPALDVPEPRIVAPLY